MYNSNWLDKMFWLSWEQVENLPIAHNYNLNQEWTIFIFIYGEHICGFTNRGVEQSTLWYFGNLNVSRIQ